MKTTFLSQEQFKKEQEAFTSAHLVQFHRPQISETLLRYVSRNRKKQKLVADYDDLLFDVSSARDVPAVYDRKEDLTKVARNLTGYAEAAALFEHRTASTVPLAKLLDEQFGGETTVIHNGLDPMYVGIAKVLNSKPRPRMFNLGYFSGTASHDRDLETIAGEIARYLEQDNSRSLLLFGPIAVPDQLKRFKSQITLRKVVSFYEMPRHIVACRTVVGPLVENIFTRCKTGLKYFEAAALGTYVAASPIPDIDRFESPLLKKYRSDEDWREAFQSAPLSLEKQAEAATQTIQEARIEVPLKIWSERFLDHQADGAKRNR